MLRCWRQRNRSTAAMAAMEEATVTIAKKIMATEATEEDTATGIVTMGMRVMALVMALLMALLMALAMARSWASRIVEMWVALAYFEGVLRWSRSSFKGGCVSSPPSPKSRETSTDRRES
jgi:hypothetical protein